jgi:sec-independent protein translocase protein TatA
VDVIAATFGPLGTPEMILIAIAVLVLFGWKKLPSFGRSLGRSMGEFRRAKDAFEQELWRSRAAHAPTPTDEERHPDGKTGRLNPNALVYLLMIISALLLAIGLGRLLGW